MGLLFERLGSGTPFLAGGLIMGILLLASLRLIATGRGAAVPATTTE